MGALCQRIQSGLIRGYASSSFRRFDPGLRAKLARATLKEIKRGHHTPEEICRAFLGYGGNASELGIIDGVLRSLEERGDAIRVRHDDGSYLWLLRVTERHGCTGESAGDPAGGPAPGV